MIDKIYSFIIPKTNKSESVTIDKNYKGQIERISAKEFKIVINEDVYTINWNEFIDENTIRNGTIIYKFLNSVYNDNNLKLEKLISKFISFVTDKEYSDGKYAGIAKSTKSNLP